MKLRQRSLLALLTGTFAALAAAGCGSKGPAVKEYKGVKVNGVILQNGKPIKLGQDETISVSFIALTGDEAGKTAFIADAKPEDGTFTIAGPTGQGIPIGRYKVTLASNFGSGGGTDRFAEKFDSETSPLNADVAGEGQTFEIDVGKRTIKAK
jgi:hypothetical protein